MDNRYGTEVRSIPDAILQVYRNQTACNILADPGLLPDLAEGIVRILLKERRTGFPAGSATGTVIPVDMDLHRYSPIPHPYSWHLHSFPCFSPWPPALITDMYRLCE